jgi:hypothetical protein
MLELSEIRREPSPDAPRPGDADATVWRDRDGVVAALGATRGAHRWMFVPNVGSFRFADGENSVTAFAEPSARDELVLDSFHRNVVPIAMQAAGREVLHGSAVLMEQGLVALVAEPETGKSTLAFALSRRGHPLWADDAVAIDVTGAAAVAAPLPFQIRLRTQSAAYFGERPREANAPLTRGTVDDRRPEPLAAVCVLARHEAASPSVVRLSEADAFSALLPHAYWFTLDERDRNRAMMESYMELAARVPVLRVSFAAGLESVPAIAQAIEHGVADAAGGGA